MKALDTGELNNDLFKRGCNCQGFIPKVTFTYTAGAVVVKDESTFPSGDSIKRINVLAHDEFGGTKAGTIAAAGGEAEIDVSGLDASKGLHLTATVFSTNQCKSDGSVRNIKEAGQIGSWSENYKAELAG